MARVIVVEEGHTLTPEEISDIWYDVFDGDLWEREMRDYGSAIIENDEKASPEVRRIALIAESRWRSAGKRTVPSVLWDSGTPSVVGF